MYGGDHEGWFLLSTAKLIDQANEDNTFASVSQLMLGSNSTKTLYSPQTRILYVRYGCRREKLPQVVTTYYNGVISRA